ncbi:hypothetical protein [Methylorubrum aminovorans]
MASGPANMAIGAGIFLVGIVVTAATWSAASGGGRYVIAYGAIGVGAVQFFIGLMSSLSGQQRSTFIDQRLSDHSPAERVFAACLLLGTKTPNALTQTEAAEVSKQMQSTFGKPFSAPLASLVGQDAGSLADIEWYVGEQVGALSEEGRKIAFHCTRSVMSAAGQVSPERLRRLAELLRLSSTPSHSSS